MPGVEHDECLHGLVAEVVGDADNGDLDDRRMLEHHALDLERSDILAGHLDHVLLAVDEVEVAVLVALGQIARVEPAVT